ncbi:MAG: FHA domain-containing protein [Kiritimatiellae bacterium]|jgi:pSer/pThr/pTyr-binding forkhead associated (FHA) protein|nr:FHA domain-containing protein [Kiritimatiellia bacterium]
MSAKTYTLKVTDGPLSGQEYPINKDTTNLGRSSTCTISIRDLLLSRTHCRFEIRDSKLFLTDLASANETLVNGIAIDEKELHHNDLIEVGESTLKVITDPPELRLANAPAENTEEKPDVLIDLGFANDNEASSDERKALLRPIIWIVGAILILLIGATLIMNPTNKSGGSKSKAKTIVNNEDLLIQYEKVEADTDNIFKYSLTLNPDGMLYAVIDDIEGNRHVRKEKKLDPELIKNLVKTVKTSGFFALEPKYAGYASIPNSLKQWKLTIAMGTKVHTCRVRDRVEPDSFKALRETLETFSKNELGIWAIQYSTDKLKNLAVEARAIADKKFAEINVRHGNLFESIKSYKEAVFYLDTVNPKPDYYAELIENIAKGENKLEKRYEDQNFKADRAINLKEWTTAANELKILREMIPDRSDPRHAEAVRKLLDVESRL